LHACMHGINRFPTIDAFQELPYTLLCNN